MANDAGSERALCQAGITPAMVSEGGRVSKESLESYSRAWILFHREKDSAEPPTQVAVLEGAPKAMGRLRRTAVLTGSESSSDRPDSETSDEVSASPAARRSPSLGDARWEGASMYCDRDGPTQAMEDHGQWDPETTPARLPARKRRRSQS